MRQFYRRERGRNKDQYMRQFYKRERGKNEDQYIREFYSEMTKYYKQMCTEM
jgi:hypothetical protein